MTKHRPPGDIQDQTPALERGGKSDPPNVRIPLLLPGQQVFSDRRPAC